MTARSTTLTPSQLRRRIEALKEAGLRVKAIRPDGTIDVEDGENPISVIPEQGGGAQGVSPSKWRDVRA
jgi:hypothetical protein